MRCHSRHIISKVHPTHLWFMTDDVHLDPMPHFPCGTFKGKKKITMRSSDLGVNSIYLNYLQVSHMGGLSILP